MFRERAEAKVLGRSDFVDDNCGGSVANSGAAGPVAAKGLLRAAEEEVENGFDEVLLDSEVDFEEGFAPNRVSPILTAGFVGSRLAVESTWLLSFLFPLAATSAILIPRSTLMLPSLRLHVFRRHAKTYRRLSWPGKTSGRSPLSCNSKTIRSLHTLHFARAADGGFDGASQTYSKFVRRFFTGWLETLKELRVKNLISKRGNILVSLQAG